jgi:hypothetical protein
LCLFIIIVVISYHFTVSSAGPSLSSHPILPVIVAE